MHWKKGASVTYLIGFEMFAQQSSATGEHGIIRASHKCKFALRIVVRLALLSKYTTKQAEFVLQLQSGCCKKMQFM
jgi:hypothetical protein